MVEQENVVLTFEAKVIDDDFGYLSWRLKVPLLTVIPCRFVLGVNGKTDITLSSPVVTSLP